MRRIGPVLMAGMAVLCAGACIVPAAESTPAPQHTTHQRWVLSSGPHQVVGHGTPASCTSAAVVAAVHRGGFIRFACGPKPVTIAMGATAKLSNTVSGVVLDGGGRVTLSGEGRRRILYLDTCDPAQVFTTSHCQDQSTPTLEVENLAFVNGNSVGQDFDGGGGGAIFDRGGQLKISNSSFTGNRCERSGPDVGGGAIRALSQYDDHPVEVVDSTFTGNVCSNGGALSSIGVSLTVLDSTFRGNEAIGTGANPAAAGTPGGGSGGAIYNDGDTMALNISGSVFKANRANEGGGAIFFVSDDRTGTLMIRHSTLIGNPNLGFHTLGLAGIFFLGARAPSITSSILR